MHCHTVIPLQLLSLTSTVPRGSGQWNSWKTCNALPLCPAAVGAATPSMQCHSDRGQWAVDFLQRTASPLGSSRQWNRHCLGAVGSATPVMHWRSADGNSWNVVPHCLAAVGSATLAMHCHTFSVQWAKGLLQSTATLHGGSGHWNSCNALPHHPGSVGSATPVMHCHTA